MREASGPQHSIAVTGATGLIGQRLMLGLRKARLPIRALVRTPGLVVNTTEIVGSLADPHALDRLVDRADAVIHLAGVAHTKLRNAAEEEQARQVNVEGTRRLARAARDAGVRHFLMMSSAHVYRGQRGLDLSEDDPTDGDTVYGRMKLEAEDIVLAARSSGMKVTILRPCLTYGPGVRFNLQALLHAIHKRYYVHVRGESPVRSMASVDTVSAAILHLLDAASTHTVFNVADRSPILLKDWVNHLADLMHVRHPRQIPSATMELLASVGTMLHGAGISAPVTRDSLQKLTSSFSISTERLALTGFSWPETRETVLREMISAEFGASRARPTHRS